MSDVYIELADERASAIFSFYNNFVSYSEQLFIDGTNAAGEEGYEKLFHDFNELIKLYHLELNSSIGYLFSTSGYVGSAEGSPDGGFWWNNAKPTNTISDLFYTNINSTAYYYRINNKLDPYAKHPYLHWNQYGTVLGSFDDRSWKNASSRSSYTNTLNPFATGSNFRMAEPLEYYGDGDNLLWGSIVYDGRWVYRNRYIGNTSYATHAYTGFYDWEIPTRSMINFTSPSLNPTPWSIFKETSWGGANTLQLVLTTHTIVNHSGGTTGTFEIPLTESPSLGNNYYSFYKDETDEIFTFEITGSSTLVSTEQYTYIGGTPSIAPGDLNTSSATFINDHSITNHSGSSTGTFRISGDPPSITTGWYLICTTNSSYGYIIQITNVESINSGIPYYTFLYREYTYESAIWPAPNFGGFNSDHVVFIKSPSIIEPVKIGNILDGRNNVWSSVYDQYYNAYFKPAIDQIVTKTQEIDGKLDNIINFDYTFIENPQVAGAQLFVAETQSFKDTLSGWLSSWIGLIGGYPANYTLFDSKWSNSSLDLLVSSGAGGIRELVDFPTNYSGNRIGILESRVNEIYNTIVGEYSLGSSEQLIPSQTQSNDNNTGEFSTGTLNFYRHDAASRRLNREDGSLTVALQSWSTYSAKVNTEIPAIEAQLDTFTSTSEYDLIPESVIATTDEDDLIEIEWEQVKAASSYTIEYKEGLSGVWTEIEATFGYVDPVGGGYPDEIPDFELNPPSSFVHEAYTIGRQPITSLSATTADGSTGLSDDFTVYDFQINIDGTGIVDVNIRGLDAITWESLAAAISNYFEENSIPAVATINEGSSLATIDILSESVGTGSSIELGPGLTNDLFSTGDIAIGASVAGSTALEAGKSYYYRIKTNNGYNISLGSHGNNIDKDWDSHSFWSLNGQTATGAEIDHGVIGLITWPSVSNFLVSGVEQNSIAPSEDYTRLEWSADPNAASYKVYRATSINGGYSLIGNPTTNLYDDTSAIPGFIYYYSVQAVASSDHLSYEGETKDLGPPIASERTEGFRGKRLWQTITLEATTTERGEITLEWTPLAGATGYVVYKATLPDGPFNPITNDDATDRIITSTSYIDDEPAKNFASTNFTSTTDGIADGNYTPNKRYYFIVVASDLNGLPTVKQYFITSPPSGTWTAQSIADDIDQKMTDLNVADCELLPMENLEESTVYKILFTTRNESEQARIEVIDGTFGDSLLPLLGGMEAAQGGGSAFPGIDIYYRVQAVEIVAGEQVRASEFSNIARGKRPII